jgi:hypothetical protein
MQVRTIVATAAMAFLGVTATEAGPSPHMRSQFGMVGLASGQTARLSAVVVDNPNTVDDPNIRVELVFLDALGNAVVGRDGAPVRLTADVRRGRAVSLDLAFGDANPPEGDRVQIRAFLKATIADVNGGHHRDLEATPALATVEIFDSATGRTQAILEPGSTLYFKEVDPGPQN